MFIITAINYTTGEITVCPLVSLTSKKGEELSFLQTDRQLRQTVPKEHLKDLKIGQAIKMTISLL